MNILKKIKKKMVVNKPNSFLKIIATVSLMLAVVLPSGAWAHKYYSIMTRVNHNTEAGSLEIIHRFFAHDIEEALSEETGEDLRFDNLSNIEPHLMRYIEANFEMASGQGAFSPDWIGYEVEGNNLWVYQEQMIEALPKVLLFQNTMLMGIFPDQINTVTLTFKDYRKSLSFMAGVTEDSLEIN